MRFRGFQPTEAEYGGRSRVTERRKSRRSCLSF
jgi:hypothetical protein